MRDAINTGWHLVFSNQRITLLLNIAKGHTRHVDLLVHQEKVAN